MLRAVALMLLVLAPTLASAQSLPSDLALVPGDALAVLHVRVGDVWKTDSMKDVRKVFEKAGPLALARLDEDFTPAPSTLDRVTLVVLPPDGAQPNAPVLATILAFSKPYSSAKVKATYLSGAKEEKAGGKSYLADDKSGIAVYFADDKTMVFSDARMLPVFLALAGKGDGVLKPSIESAPKNHLTLAVNIAKLPIPAEALNEVPLDLRPLLKTERLTMTANVTQETKLVWGFHYPTADDATAGAKAIKKAADIGRTFLEPMRREAEKALMGRRKGPGPRSLDELPVAIMGLAGVGGLNILDEFLAEPPVAVDGKQVAVSLTLPEWASQYTTLAMVSAGLALPAVQKVRNAAARAQTSNNLKQLGLAMHNFESAYGTFPPAAIVDKKGKKLLSWRVQILPYIEQNDLYRQFKLDEPWDSEHNKKLIAKMPKTFADPRHTPEKPGQTYYKVFVGKNGGFDWLEGRKIFSITDGTSNTIMIAAGGAPVTWTQPEDFEFDPEKKLPDVVGPFDDLVVAFFDGSVRVIKPRGKEFEAIMKLLIQPNDGRVIPNFDE